MAKDSFGFGTEEITWDDPWGDNIALPHKRNKIITGKNAEKYNIYEGDDFQELLYKGHTLQDIDPKKYDPKAIQKLIAWYADAREKALLYIKAHPDNDHVIKAQNDKLSEIKHVMKQIYKHKDQELLGVKPEDVVRY